MIKTRVQRRPTPEADAGTPRTRQVREVFGPCDLYRRQHFQLFRNFSNHILEFDEILKILPNLWLRGFSDGGGVNSNWLVPRFKKYFHSFSP